MKDNEQAWDIAFYGQDFSSIDDAYISFRGDENVHPIKNDEYCKQFLWDFLQWVNKESKNENNNLVIGHSDNPESSENDYNLCLKKQAENKSDTDDREESDEKDQKDSRLFGSVVGTVRTNYDISKYPKQKDSIATKFLGRKNSVNIKLMIFSRFDVLDTENIEKTKPYFLANLLMSGNLKFSKFNVDFDYDSLFDFYMLWLLLQRFKDAVLKGYFKKYQRFEKNDNRLKGSIDIARHIRLNRGMDNGKIAYSYRENSLDNIVNHLFLTAIDYIREKYPEISDYVIGYDLEFEREVQFLKYEIGYPKYNRRTIISKNNTPITHPFFYEYKELQQICLMILRDEGVSPFSGNSENIDGILYYIPDLWEDYLEKFIRRGLREYKNTLDGLENIELKAQDRMKTLTNTEGEGGNLIKPDYVFRYLSEEEQNGFYILDAKYKPQWIMALDDKLSNKIIEDYNKCIRDMAAVGGISSGVIFPIAAGDIETRVKAEKNNRSYIHLYSKENMFNYFYTFPVEILVPQKNQSFVEWQHDMNKSVVKVMDKLMPILTFEMKRKKDLVKTLAEININYKNELEEIKQSLQNYFE